MEASTLDVNRGRSLDERPRASRLADPIFKWVLTGLAALIPALIVFFFVFLIAKAHPAFAKFGVFGFTFKNNWDVSRNIYEAWALVVGTLITSAIALIIGVPIAVATALYLTELAPKSIIAPLTVLVDLLAAVPSVVYGLWGVFVLIPHLKGAEQWFSDTFSFLPFVGGNVAGPNVFIAGLILAIMILPIVSAISREVIRTVPSEHKEAALALGATRWEMIRISGLPYSRSGIVGASMLGLGRAVGETLAVTLGIGNAPSVPHQLFDQGYTLAAVIANEFGEAAIGPLLVGALIAAGLVLFVLTRAVNALARAIVERSARGRRMAGAAA